MKNRTRWSFLTYWVMSLVVICLSLIGCSTTIELTKERIVTAREFKTIRVITEGPLISCVGGVLFLNVASSLLKYTNLQVMHSNAAHYDATLKIFVEGQPLSARYRPLFLGHGFPTSQFSGATIQGYISLIVSDTIFYKQSFHGTREPPEYITIPIQWYGPSPCDAPFEVTLRFYSDFLRQLGRMIGLIYGESPLTSATNDEFSDVRDAAYFSLGIESGIRQTDEFFVDLIVGLQRYNESAARELGKLNDRRVLPSLVYALKDAMRPAVSSVGWPFRRELVKVIASIKDSTVLDTLISFLNYDDHTTRVEAAFALGQLKDFRAVEPLIAALKNRTANSSEKDIVMLALRSITGMNFSGDPRIWEQFVLQKRSVPQEADSSGVRVRLRMVQMRSQSRADAVYRALCNGTPVSEINETRDVGILRMDDLKKEVQDVLTTMRAGQFSRVFKVNSLFTIIYVDSILDANMKFRK